MGVTIMKQICVSFFALLFMSVSSLDAMESKMGSTVSASKEWGHYATLAGAGIIGREVGQVAGYFICNYNDEQTQKMCIWLVALCGASVGILAGDKYAKRSSLKVKKDVPEKQS
jgi:hypothetical protein